MDQELAVSRENPTWISRMLCDPSGVPDEARLGFMLCVLAYNVFWAVALHMGQSWNALSYSGGLATLVTAYGLGVRARGAN